MIGDVGVFLNTLLNYDKDHIPGIIFFIKIAQFHVFCEA
jgi:hypothetical protein